MPLSNNTFRSVLILLAAILWQVASLTHAQDAEVSPVESPRDVVARWL